MNNSNFNYREIFNQRGNDYHQAMLQFPHTRKAEFEAIIDVAQLNENDLVFDFPSGGGYLTNFIKPDVVVLSGETSKVFAHCKNGKRNEEIFLCHFDTFPIKSNSIDKVISLAGVHHQKEKRLLYKEANRILKPGGIFCIADVEQGSNVALFLDTWVNRFSSQGHKGFFLNDSSAKDIKNSQFDITFNESINYYWQFDSLSDMTTYCKLLFGMDKAKAHDVLLGIEKYLGYTQRSDLYLLPWQLLFIKAIKAQK